MKLLPQSVARVKWFVIGTACLMLSAACSRPTGDIQVTDAWINSPPAGASVAAAYLTIKNDTDGAVTLKELSSAAFGTVEIHQTKQLPGVNGGPGMVSMEPVQGLEIAAGEQVSMRPGGMHLMLMMPKKPVTEDGQYPLQLTFKRLSDGSVEQRDLELQVRAVQARKK